MENNKRNTVLGFSLLSTNPLSLGFLSIWNDQLDGCYTNRTNSIFMFEPVIEVVFDVGQKLFSGRDANEVQPMTSEKTSKTGKKKKYIPPRFAVLTPDQARSRLTERALPGEVLSEQLMRAAFQFASDRSGEHRPIPHDANLPGTKKGA